MHTVENAVIVPVFTLIIVALISVSGYMHDKVVMRNILNQLSIEYSRNITSNEQKALLVKSEEYIKDKTIFVKKVSVKPGSYAGKENAADGINHITCTAEWPFKLDFFGINICGTAPHPVQIPLHRRPLPQWVPESAHASHRRRRAVSHTGYAPCCFPR